MSLVHVALGSNQGPRLEHIAAARKHLERWGTIQALSRFYLTSPVEAAGGWFINAALALSTDEEPEQLLARLLQIEKELGRQRFPVERRTIDLDIILFGERVVQAPDLIIPHPRAHERRFVLQPLVDICPECLHPTIGKSIRQLLEQLTDQHEVYQIEHPPGGS